MQAMHLFYELSVKKSSPFYFYTCLYYIQSWNNGVVYMSKHYGTLLLASSYDTPKMKLSKSRYSLITIIVEDEENNYGFWQSFCTYTRQTLPST